MDINDCYVAVSNAIEEFPFFQYGTGTEELADGWIGDLATTIVARLDRAHLLKNGLSHEAAVLKRISEGDRTV